MKLQQIDLIEKCNLSRQILKRWEESGLTFTKKGNSKFYDAFVLIKFIRDERSVTGTPEMRAKKAQADRKLAEKKARKMELEVDVIEGQLVDRTTVIASNTRTGMIMKNELLDIGPRVRQDVVALLSDPASAGEVEEMINEHVRTVLNRAVARLKDIGDKGK